MSHKRRQLLPALILTFTFNSAAPPALAHHSPEARPEPPSATLAPTEKRNDRYASIVIDAKTGAVLYTRDAQQKLHPASTTKIMTAYLAFKALRDHKIKPKQKLKISHYAATREATNLRLIRPYKTEKYTDKNGRVKKKTYYKQKIFSITAEDAMRAILVQSANDAAVVLAENIAGTEKKFVTEMNKTAKELGMTNTVFTNASGLPNNVQISTVEDMAKLAQAVIRDFPEYYPFFDDTTFSFGGMTYRNHNRLLGDYDGMDGLKTGYINSSGNHLVASATRDGKRVIAVVFGAKGRAGIENDMPQLLDFGFEKLKNPDAKFVLDEPKTYPPEKPDTLETEDDEKDFGTPYPGDISTAAPEEEKAPATPASPAP